MTPHTTMAIHIIMAGITIIPGAIGLGAIMPVAIRCYAGSEQRVGRDVGRAYATNTFGAILGSVAGGLVLMPTLGVERGVLVCATLLAMTSLLLLVNTEMRRSRFGLVVISGTLLLALVGPRWDASDFTIGRVSQSLDRSRHAFASARHHDDTGAFSQHRLGDGFADTSRTACHNCGTPFQCIGHEVLHSLQV